MNVIKTQAALDAFCEKASQRPFICVDTEFMRESTFYSILCLIQAATDEDEAIIDPLSKDLDLKPFNALLLNNDVVKVLHAARQDMEIFYKLCRKVPEAIFDTQIAAMALHLRDLYPGLTQDLEAKGRMDWVIEEMKPQTAEKLYTFEPEMAWERLKIRNPRKPYLAALKAAAAWREREAISKNVPRRRVLKDDALYDLAQQKPKDLAALSRLRGIPKGFEKSRSAKALVDSINAALDNADDYAPHIPKAKHMPSNLGPTIEMLRTLLRLRTEYEDIAPRMVANNSDIEQLAAFGAKAEVAALTGWRRKIFGDDALKMLDGQITLRLNGREVVAEKIS